MFVFCEAVEYLLEHITKHQTDPKAENLLRQVRELNDEARVRELACDNEGDEPRISDEERRLLAALDELEGVSQPTGEGSATATLNDSLAALKGALDLLPEEPK